MKQLEFTTLKLFVAVADAGSLSGAAEHCNISIAALSKRISDLETSSGSPFFYRHARGMTLTPAGRALVQHAREIIFSIERMNNDLNQYKQGVKGHVRVAANDSSMTQFLPAELKQFGDQHPNIVIDLTEWSSQQIIEGVVDGRVDMGIFTGPCTHEELVTFPYHQDHLCVVAPIGHPLTKYKSARFADTLNYDFIVSAPQGSIFQRLMAESGSKLKVRMSVRSSYALCRMVAAGLGIGIGPFFMGETHVKSMQIALVPLEEVWARRQLLIGIRSEEGLSGAARTFLAHCRSFGRLQVAVT